MQRTFLFVAAVLGFLGVAAGAFGAHALREQLDPARLAIFETGARYQMYHALALLGVALASARWPSPWWTGAAILFVAGVLIFSGSLYTLSLTGTRAWGAVTPIGGVCLLAGWIAVLVAALRGVGG